MLHFPSANSAAHRPAARDIEALRQLLDDDVWAFSNCRVDAAPSPVSEIDWFFYNARHGTFMVSEWKRYPQRVATATDTGTPWLLDGGMSVANPIEQVSRQLDAARLALRGSILPRHFPGFDGQELRLMQSVYCPQVDGDTAIERIRWGKVYGRLPELTKTVSDSASRAPLVLPDAGARFSLAKALCALFRTSMPPEVEAKLLVPEADAATRAAQRISAIHRQLAALHEELADLMLVSAAGTPQPAKPPAPPTEGSVVTEHQRMQAHLLQSFKNVNGSPEAAVKALEKAWLAVLRDPMLHGDHGISVSLFGSVATPLVKQKHESLKKVLGMQLRPWCVQQADAAGLQPSDAPGKPSNILLRPGPGALRRETGQKIPLV